MTEILDYEALVRDYNQALNTQLRGFRPAADYLDTWVPDDNPIKGILNLVEAAQMSGRPSVALRLSAAILKDLNLEELKRELSPLGGVSSRQTEQGFELTVGGLTGEETERRPVPGESRGASPYRLRLGRIAATESPKHQGRLTSSDSTVPLENTVDGVVLRLAVDPASQKIREAKFSGAVSPEENALMDRFCGMLVGLPLQEAADHGVQRLEYSLRDLGHPARGIVTPENADPMFARPLALVRGIFAEFKKKSSLPPAVNFYERSPARTWLERGDEDKQHLVQSVIDREMSSLLPSGARYRVTKLQGPGKTRVFGEFTGETEVPAALKASSLMATERALRREVEGRLEVFMEEWKDQNSKRRL